MPHPHPCCTWLILRIFLTITLALPSVPLLPCPGTSFLLGLQEYGQTPPPLPGPILFTVLSGPLPVITLPPPEFCTRDQGHRSPYTKARDLAVIPDSSSFLSLGTHNEGPLRLKLLLHGSQVLPSAMPLPPVLVFKLWSSLLAVIAFASCVVALSPSLPPPLAILCSAARAYKLVL